ncbi:MAG: hypothetical protein II995_04905, partial [Oscillospiraceae bacterium]|nr:hypothetical protein [Oscillospiraceae bacterium]
MEPFSATARLKFEVKRFMKYGRGDIVRMVIMVLMPVLALGYLYYSLETYHRVVHSDAGFLVGACALGCIVVNFILWLKNR